MDKLREEIVKLSNSEPNAPLSEAQNSILQQHLDHLMSGLQTTPDHPPYAWMIEKALQELDEEGVLMKTRYLSLSRRIMTDGFHFLVTAKTRIQREKERARKGGVRQIHKRSSSKRKKRRILDMWCIWNNKKEGCGRPAKNKEDGAKKGDGTTSALATKELDDQRERALKGQEDRADPDAVLVKDSRLSRRSKTIKD
ncbi:hypothetical protein H5410_019529 [Solanum commersonii]|uniref:Uncharacterized protein n=1 Tax=Solanum commersonii TaxID=4109 RepID=A0A9J5Z8K0_SOLCO|nr:hypothetical protein H5410_019529 [Solanum commersonii]